MQNFRKCVDCTAWEKSLKMQSKNWGVLSLDFPRELVEISLFVTLSFAATDCSRALLIWVPLWMTVKWSTELYSRNQSCFIRNSILILYICVHIGIYLLLLTDILSSYKNLLTVMTSCIVNYKLKWYFLNQKLAISAQFMDTLVIRMILTQQCHSLNGISNSWKNLLSR